jgi:hypothetical protein
MIQHAIAARFMPTLRSVEIESSKTIFPSREKTPSPEWKGMINGRKTVGSYMRE